jgi:hypothetical protein
MQAAVQLKQKPDTNDHIPQQTQLKHIPLEMKKIKQAPLHILHSATGANKAKGPSQH